MVAKLCGKEMPVADILVLTSSKCKTERPKAKVLAAVAKDVALAGTLVVASSSVYSALQDIVYDR